MVHYQSSLKTKNLFIFAFLLIASCNLWSIVESKPVYVFWNDYCSKGGGVTPEGCETWSGAVLEAENKGAAMREFFAIVTTPIRKTSFRGTTWDLIAKTSWAKTSTSATHVYAEIMIKGAPGDASYSIAFFGPLSIRRESNKKWMRLAALPGFMSYTNNNAKFRYFVPSVEDEEVKKRINRNHWPNSHLKTSFEAKLKVHVNCYSESSQKSCTPDETMGTYETSVALYPKTKATLSGTLNDVKLTVSSSSSSLSFKYTWAESDEKDKFWEKNSNCDVKYETILYESGSRVGINTKIRAVLAKVGGKLGKGLEDTLNVSADLLRSNTNFLGQLEFLNRNTEMPLSESNNLYKGWQPAGGLKIAFTVCDCAKQESVECREYLHEGVVIEGSIPETADD